MQKCKYLDDLGIPINEYGTNFMEDTDHRAGSWAKEREEYGFDNRETWNLDRIFIEWIYTRVLMYKEYTICNLDYHKFTYKDSEITQAEAIDKILELSNELENKYYNKFINKELNVLIEENNEKFVIYGKKYSQQCGGRKKMQL